VGVWLCIWCVIYISYDIYVYANIYDMYTCIFAIYIYISHDMIYTSYHISVVS
jgi:hypothetical protein